MKGRIVLGGVVAALALTGVWPARAASTPTAVVDSPAEGAIWTGAAPTHFHVTGHADTESGGNVSRVTASFSPDDGNTHAPYVGSQAWTDTRNSRTFDFTVFPDINGKYKMTLGARGRTACGLLGCPSEADGPPVVRSITVAVAPKAPTGTKSSEADGKVTVEWNANNTEGDLLGYLVERLVPTHGDYTCLTTLAVKSPAPETYKITDDIEDLPSGDYRWRIRAVRAVNSETTLGTCAKPGPALNSPASASTKITWTNPTPPSTTTSTTRPGGGGGGGGGTGSTTSTTKPKSSTGTPAPSRTSNPSSRPNLSALGSLGGASNLARTPLLPREVDPGFNELLPFQAGSEGDLTEDDGSALNQTPLQAEEASNGQTTTLLFIAAGLLATVLSMHVLWLKAQVDRMPLEPLTPQDIALP